MKPTDKLPVIHALWIGDKLGLIAAACLRSFVEQGHETVLHCYHPIQDIPEGVSTRDANETIPEKFIFKHKKSGSYAVFSDLFTYELLNNQAGIYVDCDVFCIAPLTIPHHGYLLGYEDDQQINCAVLAAPIGSDFLNALLNISRDAEFIPPWLSERKQKKLKLRKALGFSASRDSMKWGTTGPAALTYYAKIYGIQDLAQPVDKFYPLECHRTKLLLDPELSVEDIVTSRSSCIHLYNEKFKKHDISNIPPTSPLGRMLRFA
ncbi:galactosyltransferase Lgt5 [Salinicola sp. RZ23]|uniref:galactosyltransferase Lgt5 n=1 Tax=Salinicola sp. RZ23 TaxID=1949087 RepID=UPI000DA23F9F|nr:galactosyltransferase Lgt5 [Salinicola sp. RZ23]